MLDVADEEIVTSAQAGAAGVESAMAASAALLSNIA
jgi:hypothetical protein